MHPRHIDPHPFPHLAAITMESFDLAQPVAGHQDIADAVGVDVGDQRHDRYLLHPRRGNDLAADLLRPSRLDLPLAVDQQQMNFPPAIRIHDVIVVVAQPTSGVLVANDSDVQAAVTVDVADR